MIKKKPNNRIAFIGRFNEGELISGPEKTAKRIFERAAEEYVPVYFQYFFDGNKHGITKKLFGYEERYEGVNRKICTAGIVRLFMLLIRFKPALIHILTFERFAAVAVYYAYLWRIKLIYSSHGIVVHEDNSLKMVKSFYRFKNRYAEKLLLKRSWRIVFPSDSSLLLGEKYYSIDESKIRIIPNGIDEAFHKIVTSGPREGIVMLSGNELHNSRREFLKKFLKTADVNFQLYVVGNKEYFSSLNLSGVYFFNAMYSSELAEFYGNKDIFLSLNEYDTFSISAVEAMASGLIPIVTKQTGMSSLIFNNVNGYVIDYGDVDQLKASICKLLTMGKIEKETMRNNAKSIYYKLSWDNVFMQYESLYKASNK